MAELKVEYAEVAEMFRHCTPLKRGRSGTDVSAK